MTHHHFAGRLAGLVLLAAACAFDATLPLPAVTVTGPVANTTALRNPDHGYPYNATPLDLDKQGYIEQEFFIEGKANAYQPECS